jgi:hypothetical protein
MLKSLITRAPIDIVVETIKESVMLHTNVVLQIMMRGPASPLKTKP